MAGTIDAVGFTTAAFELARRLLTPSGQSFVGGERRLGGHPDVPSEPVLFVVGGVPQFPSTFYVSATHIIAGFPDGGTALDAEQREIVDSFVMVVEDEIASGVGDSLVLDYVIGRATPTGTATSNELHSRCRAAAVWEYLRESLRGRVGETAADEWLGIPHRAPADPDPQLPWDDGGLLVGLGSCDPILDFADEEAMNRSVTIQFRYRVDVPAPEPPPPDPPPAAAPPPAEWSINFGHEVIVEPWVVELLLLIVTRGRSEKLNRFIDKAGVHLRVVAGSLTRYGHDKTEIRPLMLLAGGVQWDLVDAAVGRYADKQKARGAEGYLTQYEDVLMIIEQTLAYELSLPDSGSEPDLMVGVPAWATFDDFDLAVFAQAGGGWNLQGEYAGIAVPFLDGGEVAVATQTSAGWELQPGLLPSVGGAAVVGLLVFTGEGTTIAGSGY